MKPGNPGRRAASEGANSTGGGTPPEDKRADVRIDPVYLQAAPLSGAAFLMRRTVRAAGEDAHAGLVGAAVPAFLWAC